METVFSYGKLCWSFWNSEEATFFKRNLVLVETDFLASGNFFIFYILLLVKGIFRLAENEFFIPYGEDGFSLFWKPFSLIWFFPYKCKPPLKLMAHFFCGKDFISARNREFLSGEKCFILFRASFLRGETVSETSWNKKGCTFNKWPFLISM